MREEEENMLEKLFHLKENKTTVKTEVTAGITSFFTMAYIIFVNPQILSAAGMDPGAVMLATCVASAIGTFLMAFLANYPFALAPGMGLNAFFAFTICGSMGYSWQAALAGVFVSGLIFIVIRTFIFGDPTSGWPSMVSIFLFVGGLQLLCLGIIGKYIGKIFLETKNRPLYFLKETEKDQEKQ